VGKLKRPGLFFLLAGAALALAVLLLKPEIGRALLGSWSFTKSVDDHATYFRLKIKLTYKGGPQDFDIVVGCNVRTITYKDNSTTYEAGLVPTVYGRRMIDGKGLVIRPPDACRGQTTANGGVPTNFMPVVIVYDDADTLGFGTAYISDDAYGSPLSLLGFGGATVETATRAEFERFRSEGPANLVTRNSYHSYQGEDVVAKMGLRKVWPSFGAVCHAYSRLRVPEEVRGAIRQYWPDSRPRYWRPAGAQLLTRAVQLIVRRDRAQRDDGGPIVSIGRFWGSESLPDRGVVRAVGGGIVEEPQPLAPLAPSVYPASSEFSANFWPHDPDLWPAFLSARDSLVAARIEFSDGRNRGFAYCYSPPSLPASSAVVRLAITKHSVSYVSSEEIDGSQEELSLFDEPSDFFEADQYRFSEYRFGLSSHNGDV
jgi:hypothetical protein